MLASPQSSLLRVISSLSHESFPRQSGGSSSLPHSSHSHHLPLLLTLEKICSRSTVASLTQYLLSIYSVLSSFLDKDVSCSPSCASCQGLGAAVYPTPGSHGGPDCAHRSLVPLAVAWGEAELSLCLEHPLCLLPSHLYSGNNHKQP